MAYSRILLSYSEKKKTVYINRIKRIGAARAHPSAIHKYEKNSIRDSIEVRMKTKPNKQKEKNS